MFVIPAEAGIQAAVEFRLKDYCGQFGQENLEGPVAYVSVLSPAW